MNFFKQNGLENVQAQKVSVRSGGGFMSFGSSAVNTYNVMGEIPGREDCWCVATTTSNFTFL